MTAADPEHLPACHRIAVIGDVHLGRGDAETGFAGTADRMCTFIAQVAASADLLVVNGDLYDLDRGSRPCAQSLEYVHLVPTWAPVEAALQRVGARLTAGNHDWALRGRTVGHAPVVDAYRVQVGALRVHIEHGERFNAWVKRHRGFTSFVTWLSGRVARGPLRPLYRLLRFLEARTTNDDAGGVTARAARWLRAQSEIDVMVIGHTHQALVERVDAQWLLNPGDAMGERFGYLVIDGQQSEVVVGCGDGLAPLCELRRHALVPSAENATCSRSK